MFLVQNNRYLHCWQCSVWPSDWVRILWQEDHPTQQINEDTCCHQAAENQYWTAQNITGSPWLILDLCYGLHHQHRSRSGIRLNHWKQFAWSFIFMTFIPEIHVSELRIEQNVYDPRSLYRYLVVVTRKARTGIRTLTSAIPVQCSTSWAMRPTRSWLSCGSMIDP